MALTKLKPEALPLLEHPQGRVTIATESFYQFLLIYYAHRFTVPSAPFHGVLVETLQDVNDFIAILGFRGSAKSTILEAYALWCMVTGRSPFTVYIGQTKDKSSAAIMNIRAEIENNALLRSDFAIVLSRQQNQSINFKWTESQLIVKGCTIVAKSRGDSIRGALQNGERITLIICDDLEDTDSTRSDDQRAKTREWFFTEVVPATSQGVLGANVKIVMLGNLVHRNCLLLHLEGMALDNKNLIRVIRFPLIDANGEITWKGLYPDMEAVEKAKQKVLLAGKGLGEVIWAREYLLKLVDADEQIIKDSDIQYYDMELLQKPTVGSGCSTDLAISKKQTADYSVIVRGVMITNEYGERRLLILPKLFRQRVGFERFIAECKLAKAEMPAGTQFTFEKVGYQEAAIEIAKKNGIPVVELTRSQDKRARLISASPYIKSGMVLFPKVGAGAILSEVLGFGIEPHDDVCDAVVDLIENMLSSPNVVCV